jgi:hypothetical protein
LAEQKVAVVHHGAPSAAKCSPSKLSAPPHGFSRPDPGQIVSLRVRMIMCHKIMNMQNDLNDLQVIQNVPADKRWDIAGKGHFCLLFFSHKGHYLLMCKRWGAEGELFAACVHVQAVDWAPQVNSLHTCCCLNI